jgi:hypothetical protein
MMLFIFLGWQIGKWKAKNTEKKPESSGLTALLFFLLAFTFGMSGARFDDRRKIIVEEANHISTALLRSDMYPQDERSMFISDFKEYVEARIEYFMAGADIKRIIVADSLTQLIFSKLWARATRLSANPANLAASNQMIPALNNMIDITTKRLMGEKAKVPESILYMLFFLACISSFYAGYIAGRKSHIDWAIEVGFCLLVSLVVLFTLDLDRPRRGFINLDGPNQAIIDLRKNFK